MSFHEVRFPDKIAYGASGGPQFNTSIISLFSGFEQRNINWSIARGEWDVSTGIKSKQDADEIVAFFRARKGMAYGFRFKDWSDFEAVSQDIGTGNGILVSFQCFKVYSDSAGSYTREITKTVNNSVFKVYKDDVLQVSGYSVNHNTGVVTFDTPPANSVVISVDFEFDVPVRFNSDLLNLRIQSHNQFVADSITVVEIKL